MYSFFMKNMPLISFFTHSINWIKNAATHIYTWRSNSDGTRGSSIFAAKDKHATDRSCSGHPFACCKHSYNIYQTVSKIKEQKTKDKGYLLFLIQRLSSLLVFDD